MRILMLAAHRVRSEGADPWSGLIRDLALSLALEDQEFLCLTGPNSLPADWMGLPVVATPDLNAGVDAAVALWRPDAALALGDDARAAATAARRVFDGPILCWLDAASAEAQRATPWPAGVTAIVETLEEVERLRETEVPFALRIPAFRFQGGRERIPLRRSSQNQPRRLALTDLRRSAGPHAPLTWPTATIDARLVFVESAPLEPSWAETLTTYARARGNVAWLHLDAAGRPPPFAPQCDAALFPSPNGCCAARAILDALAFGLPVLAADTATARSTVRNPRWRVTASASNARAWRDALNDLTSAEGEDDVDAVLASVERDAATATQRIITHLQRC